MRWLKISLTSIAGFLVLVVILQNTDTVETRLLSATVEWPRAVLLFVTLAIGFVLGVATSLWVGLRRRAKQRHETEHADADAA